MQTLLDRRQAAVAAQTAAPDRGDPGPRTQTATSPPRSASSSRTWRRKRSCGSTASRSASARCRGLELDEPKLGAFAGFLNALDFPVQLLVRQHPPDLARMRDQLRETQPESLPPQTREAADSLQVLLGDLERRDGILDRRFYAVLRAGPCGGTPFPPREGGPLRPPSEGPRPAAPAAGRGPGRHPRGAGRGGSPSRSRSTAATCGSGTTSRAPCTSGAGRARSPPASSRG